MKGKRHAPEQILGKCGSWGQRTFFQGSRPEQNPMRPDTTSTPRDPGQNLRTQLHRIIRKGGLEHWEKPFQYLRSTRGDRTGRDAPDSCSL